MAREKGERIAVSLVAQPHSLSTGAVSFRSIHGHLPRLPALCPTIPSAPTCQYIIVCPLPGTALATGDISVQWNISPLCSAPHLQPSRQKPCLPQTFFLDPPLPPPVISSSSLLGIFISLITAPSERLLCARHHQNYSSHQDRISAHPKVWPDQE